jgi:hypothetical protein
VLNRIETQDFEHECCALSDREIRIHQWLFSSQNGFAELVEQWVFNRDVHVGRSHQCGHMANTSYNSVNFVYGICVSWYLETMMVASCFLPA